MVSLVLLSHSREIIAGLKELIHEMVPEIIVYGVGGTAQGTLGSDYDETLRVIKKAYSKDGVIVLFDLGSTFMTAEMVKDSMNDEEKESIYLADAPLIEGAITAAVSISGGFSALEVMKSLEPLRIGKL